MEMNIDDFEPTMAFAVERQEPPAIEVRVNFGVFAGREATAAEIERLAEWLLDEVGEVSIISEERHEIDANVEASVHQVRIEVAADRVPPAGPERQSVIGAARRARGALGAHVRGGTPRRDRRRRLARADARLHRACASPDARRSHRDRARRTAPEMPASSSSVCQRINVPSPSGMRSKVDVTSAPPPCACSRACSGGRRSSTSKRMVTPGANGSGGLTFACQ